VDHLVADHLVIIISKRCLDGRIKPGVTQLIPHNASPVQKIIKSQFIKLVYPVFISRISPALRFGITPACRLGYYCFINLFNPLIQTIDHPVRGQGPGFTKMAMGTVPEAQFVFFIKTQQMVQPLRVKRVETIHLHMTSIGSFCQVYPVLINATGRIESIHKHGMLRIVGKKLITPGIICPIVYSVEIIGSFVCPKGSGRCIKIP